MKKTIAPLICAALVAAVPASAFASEHHRMPRSAPQLAAIDSQWLQTAIQANVALVNAAQLAESKSTNGAILKLARLIISGHSRLLRADDRLAHRLGVAIPASADATETSQLNTLSTLTGKAFNLQFAQDELLDHENFLLLTEQEIAQGMNRAVKAAAHVWTPLIQHRINLAKGAVALFSK